MARTVKKPTDCQFCGCPESKHCAGGVSHFDSPKREGYREEVICVGRHCTTVLCCCVRYIGPEEPAPARVCR